MILGDKDNLLSEGYKNTWLDSGTVASVVIQAIESGTNEKTLMKATHPMIRLGQFGACTKLVWAIGYCLHNSVNHKSH